MNKTFTLMAFATAALLFAQCSTKKAATTPAPSTTAVEKHYSEAELAEGKTIWQEKCNKCHKLYLPESHTAAKWDPILTRMTKKAKLDDQQAGLVRAYVLANAKN
jgi:cytochrome c5